MEENISFAHLVLESLSFIRIFYFVTINFPMKILKNMTDKIIINPARNDIPINLYIIYNETPNLV